MVKLRDLLETIKAKAIQMDGVQRPRICVDAVFEIMLLN